MSKIIGYIIIALISFIYTSTWWIVCMLEDYIVLFRMSRIIVTVGSMTMTLIVTIGICYYLINNWKEIWDIKE